MDNRDAYEEALEDLKDVVLEEVSLLIFSLLVCGLGGHVILMHLFFSNTNECFRFPTPA